MFIAVPVFPAFVAVNLLSGGSHSSEGGEVVAPSN